AQAVVAVAELLGRPTQLVEPHHLAAGERIAQRVRLLLPELHPVIDGVDRAGGFAADVGRVAVHLFGAGWMLSTQCTSWGFSIAGMSRFTTTACCRRRHRTHRGGSGS